MEFNQLPEDYDGPQKRHTEFESWEAKWSYDAKNLIEMARKKYGRENVTVRDALDLTTRKDDDLEILRRYIAMEIKGKGEESIKEAGDPTELPVAAASAALQAPEKVLTVDQRTSLFSTLQARLTSDTQRYKDIQWPKVAAALEAAGDKVLYGLFQMEENGHEVGVTKVEKGSRKGFRFDSCSKVSPTGIRDIDYFKAQNIAREWSGNGAVDLDLMDPQVFEELRVAGIITNIDTWDYLRTENPGTPEKPGRAWCGDSVGVREFRANFHDHGGGFRCSLWVPEA